MPEARDSGSSSRTRRVIGVVFGIFFIALAVIIVVTSTVATRRGAIVVALVVGALGADLIVSTMRRRRSLISRIGPLP